MSVAFAAPRQRGKGEITPAAIQKVSSERRPSAGRGGGAARRWWGRAPGSQRSPLAPALPAQKRRQPPPGFPAGRVASRRGVRACARRGREGSGPRDSRVAPPRRDPARGSGSPECCAANSSELRPSRENLGTFRRGSGQAGKDPVGTGIRRAAPAIRLPLLLVDASERAGQALWFGRANLLPAAPSWPSKAVYTDGRAVCIESG